MVFQNQYCECFPYENADIAYFGSLGFNHQMVAHLTKALIFMHTSEANW